jgi:predicted HNH restriction endonuclease
VKAIDQWDKKQAAYLRRKVLQDKAIAYLGGKCQICGYNKCNAAIEFHHSRDYGKAFCISSALTSWERILPELEKCVLLCSNCHREVHQGLHSSYIIDEAWDYSD